MFSSSVDGIFTEVGVEVADNQNTRSSVSSGSVAAQVRQRRRRARPRQIAIALPIAQIRVAQRITVRSLGFEVVGYDRDAGGSPRSSSALNA